MKWFGESWGAPACDPSEHVDTPVGRVCVRCELQIKEHDQGVVLPHALKMHVVVTECWHLGCFLDELGVPHRESR